jgi:hypothetical protein
VTDTEFVNRIFKNPEFIEESLGGYSDENRELEELYRRLRT